MNTCTYDCSLKERQIIRHHNNVLMCVGGETSRTFGYEYIQLATHTEVTERHVVDEITR